MLIRPAAAAAARGRGFTLIEMVVTLAVLALILAMAMPGIGTWIDNTRIRGATQALQAGMQSARMEAIRRNQPISFYLVSSASDPSTLDDSCALSSTSGSWVVSASSPAGKCASMNPSTCTSTVPGQCALAQRAIGDAGAQVKVSAGYSTNASNMTALGTSADTITFDGMGRVANATSAINRVRITGPDATANYVDLMLIVDVGGGVRMCDPRSSIGTEDPRKC